MSLTLEIKQLRDEDAVGSETGNRNSEIARQLGNWNVENGDPGYVFDSSTGFTLPSGAERSPDASWIERTRYEASPPGDRERFAHICPDFVIELMSPSDRRGDLQARMREYIDSGVRLGWLIDRKNRRVMVYRPGVEPSELDDPTVVSAEPELPGFVLTMARIF